MSNIVLSATALGSIGQPHPSIAGHVVTMRSTFVFSSAVTSAQIIEFGALPNDCILTDYMLLSEGSFTGLTGDVGLLAGEYGQNVAGRTLTANLFDDVDLTVALSRPALNAGLLLAPSPLVRGIGLQTSGNVAAATSKKLTLIWSYISAP
jgi:hypothetical protein